MADEVITRFLERYQSKSTRDLYGHIARSYFGFFNIAPEAYFNTDRDYKRDVEDYCSSMKGRPPKTFYVHVSTIKQLFLRYEVVLPDSFWKGLKVFVKGNGAVTIDRIPNKEEVKLLLTHSDTRMRAVILTLLSSGARIGEITKIHIEDVDFESEPVKVTIRGEYTKTGETRITFLSDEAKEAVLAWMAIRKKHLKKVSKTMNLKGDVDVNDKRLFPASPHSLSASFKVVLERANMTQRDRRTNRMEIHFHSFRKYFRTTLSSSMSIDVIEVLMGHKGYLADAYLRFNEEDLKKAYIASMNVISVYSSNEESSAMEAMRQEIEALKQQLDDQHREMLEMRIEKIQKYKKEWQEG